MNILYRIAEEKIQDSMRKGEFDNLEGKGKPIQYEDDSMVPEDLRMAYKLLKNSGHLPPEVLEEREINTIKELLANCQDEQERCRQIQKLNFLVMKLNERRAQPVDLEREQLYYDKIVERLSLPSKKP